MSGMVKNDFERAAERQHDVSLPRELLGLVCNNKKWWLVPLLLVFLLVGLVLLASGSAAAPLIYTLF